MRQTDPRLLLQLAVLLLALVPGAKSVHHYMLLGLTEQERGPWRLSHPGACCMHPPTTLTSSH